MRSSIIAGCALLLLQPRALKAEDRLTPASSALTSKAMLDHVHAGIEQLNRRFWSPVASIWFDGDGMDPRAYLEKKQNPPWWPSANAVELLIDFMNISGTSDYDSNLASLYRVQKNANEKKNRIVSELKRLHLWTEVDEAQLNSRTTGSEPEAKPHGYYTDFQNEFLDDSGWWGITWLKMYHRTHTAKYLETAIAIHAHMAKNWRPDKGGGLLWCEEEGKQRPNTITNSLFLILSARLYQQTKDSTYLKWAVMTLTWFKEAELYDGIAIVDGPHHHGDYWSYNQGAYIGGLCSLYEATSSAEYLYEAVKVAESVLDQSGLARPNGVIVEKLGTRGDASLFKGIFVRYLSQLRDMLSRQKLQPAMVAKIDRSIRASAASILQSRASPEELYPSEWQAAAGTGRASFQSHLSALMALLAASKAAEGVQPEP